MRLSATTLLTTSLFGLFALFGLFGATGTSGQQLITGKVAEVMDSGGYTYVLLQRGSAKLWVAVPETKGIKKGREMSFYPGAEMVNFESKTLNRTFDRIIFSGGPAGKEAIKKDASKPKEPIGGKVKVVDTKEKISVGKAQAPNAYTVADIYKNSSSLNKKAVAVKGKVVKVSAGIMRRNWIHIQDGTGDPKKGTNNLVVTSQELPNVGEVITVSGTMSKNRDFGGGYVYQVIVEDAAISR